MPLTRRQILKSILPATIPALAAPFTGQVKITSIKTLGLDNLGDGCLI